MDVSMYDDMNELSQRLTKKTWLIPIYSGHLKETIYVVDFFFQHHIYKELWPTHTYNLRARKSNIDFSLFVYGNLTVKIGIEVL